MVGRLLVISSNNIYGVGTDGLIVHYNGIDWQKIESGTTTDINDIWGSTNPQTGEMTILCTVTDRYHQSDYGLLKIKGNFVKDTLRQSLPPNVYTVWFTEHSPVYIGGGYGLFSHQDTSWIKIDDLPSYYPTRIRGNTENDIFVVGAFGLCVHYSGFTWLSYPEVYLPNGSYEGLSFKKNLVLAVGFQMDIQQNAWAIVARGYRNQ